MSEGKIRRRFKRWWVRVVLAAGVTLVVGFGLLWRSAIRSNRSGADRPFRIAGNLYSVGSNGVTSFLLTGPEGHVLIDGGYPETAPVIVANIAKIGYDIADVKVLLNTHAHSDHAGGLRTLQEMSGAQLWVSEGDAEVMADGGAGDPALGPLGFIGYYLGELKFTPPRIDHRFKDGDTIRRGPLELIAHVTAGHTRGCTSWEFTVHDGDRPLLVVDVGSLTLFPTVSPAGPEAYPGIRADFERSFAVLRSLPADIFLASHSEMFDMKRKLDERVIATNPTAPFIDRDGYLRYIDAAEERFREALADQHRWFPARFTKIILSCGEQAMQGR
jgi:metallo-beta-lactamase class B